MVQTFNSASGSLTLPLIDGRAANYTASCYVNNQTTTPTSCQKTLSVTIGGSDGDTYRCEGATQSGSTVKCIGNSKVDSFYLKCGNTIKGPKNASSDGGARYATFDCSDEAYQCYVYDKTVTEIGDYTWRTSHSCVEEGEPGDGGGGGGCGNGILQINKGEQCDMGSKNGENNANGKPYACDNECKLRCTGPNQECILTTPNG